MLDFDMRTFIQKPSLLLVDTNLSHEKGQKGAGYRSTFAHGGSESQGASKDFQGQLNI